MAALSAADRVRRMQPCPCRRRAHLAGTPPTQRLVASPSRRRPRRPRPMPGRAVLPSDRRRLVRRGTDSDPGRRPRGSGVGERIGRQGLPFTCRYVRLRPRFGRHGRARVRLRDGRRRRRSRRRDGRRRRRGRFRCGRRLGRGRRVGRATRRKELERVDVRLGVTDPYAEVHVRHVVLRLPGRAGLCELVPFRDRLATTDVQPSEMSQRRLVLACRDGDREAVGGDRPGERHRAGRGRAERERRTEPDVDATMLPGRIRVAADREPAQERAVRGPGHAHAGEQAASAPTTAAASAASSFVALEANMPRP
jgi:hypothetical protein